MEGMVLSLSLTLSYRDQEYAKVSSSNMLGSRELTKYSLSTHCRKNPLSMRREDVVAVI